ncbi:MAG: LppX_LprAFG lipoprotein [Chloroflexi bacterium]|nr:LppX_LprAFG lipoprotein [Chloroflexota bacterium]
MPELRLHPRLLGPLRPLLATCVVAAFAVMIAAYGCGGRPVAPTSTPAAPSITADEVVRRSAESMRQLQTFRFRLSHPSGSTLLPGGISLDDAEGAVVAPDRLQVFADASSGRSFVKLSVVAIGDDAWVTNPLTGSWVKAPPGGSPFSTFDPAGLVGGILAGVTEARFSQGASPSGGAFRILGRAGASILEPLVGEVDRGRTVEFELLIDAVSFRLSRAEIRGAVSTGEDPATVRVVDLSDFDAGIEIQPPI